MTKSVEELKQESANRAAAYVESGMVLGLGSGTTATRFLHRLAELLRNGTLHDIVGVPTSIEIGEHARRLGVPLSTLDEHPILDLTVDGADEVDPNLDVIKGGGGALLHEKIVAQASKREIIVVDESKLSPALGKHWPVPVEVIHFGWRTQVAYLESLGAKVILRRAQDGTIFETDEGNVIIDCNFGAITSPYALGSQLDRRTGIVGHGLFLGLASEVIVAGQHDIRHIYRQKPSKQ